MKGQMWVESVGAGSQFHFSIVHKTSVVKAKSSYSWLKTLAAEDEDFNFMCINEVLSNKLIKTSGAR